MSSHFVPRPALPAETQAALQANGVPLVSLEEACAGCHKELGEHDVEDYPPGFEVDLDSVMLGSVNAYGRQILISSGKSDWIREVTEGGLPELVKNAYDASFSSKSSGSFLGKLAKKIKGGDSIECETPIQGIYPLSSSGTATPTNTEPPRLSILSSSFHSSGNDDEESVIVLPDYKVVHHVSSSTDGAAALVTRHLDPAVGRTGAIDVLASSSPLRSFPLPYSAVVLICSHKRRDKRCHIAAPLLISQFHHHLARLGYTVDERGDGLNEAKPIEDWPEDNRESQFEEGLRGVKRGGNESVGLFKVSHIGGHRYAGNVIVVLPSGVTCWYGRVQPRDIGAIVQSTIVEGKVIPELLRGGLGLLHKNGPEGVLSW